ncbi:WD40 associated region in TFIID subunit-domain-containing protein [Jimgerdemannia flammicorona]|uniref:WD40 associated region in TFIID subunit-domain-containing protein n=1 Tax=Jimgerdemannia flammicorona TaxID=994334 RepID=A0A433BXB4_9FUNG|nr:WD40 associated region in TFIID subunit-domain-containing protein [Jimgerdemannia flammicorona]
MIEMGSMVFTTTSHLRTTCPNFAVSRLHHSTCLLHTTNHNKPFFDHHPYTHSFSMASETNPSSSVPPVPITAAGVSGPPPNVNKVVIEYLRHKGFHQPEAILRQGANVQSLEDLASEFDSQKGDATMPGYVQYYTEAEAGSPEAYDVSYRMLREWIENSLDWYKASPNKVQSPSFISSFSPTIPILTHSPSTQLAHAARHFMTTYRSDHAELHTPDVARLATVTDAQHVRENELAQIYRTNKYNLRMSSVPWELFLNYLQDNRLMLMLRIVNQYLNIQVISAKTRKTAGLESDDVIGITGHRAQQLEAFNQQKVTLGQLPQEQPLRDEIEQSLKDEDARRAQAQGGDHPMNGDVSSSYLETFKRVKQEVGVESPAPGEIPLPPYAPLLRKLGSRGTDVQAEVDAIKDLRKRLALGPGSLPSVCCYTFHNSHDGLNCLSISEDTSLVAGGFSESYVKVWSLKGEKLRALKNNINPAHVNDLSDLNRLRERHGSEVKRLVGHSGPVFGVSFSHDNKYLISCSEDKTGSPPMEYDDIHESSCVQGPQLSRVGRRLWPVWVLLRDRVARQDRQAVELRSHLPVAHLRWAFVGRG